MEVNVGIGDNLSEVLNKQGNEQLVVNLPAKSVFDEDVVVERDGVIVFGNGARIKSVTVKGNKILLREVCIEKDLVQENDASETVFDECTINSEEGVKLYGHNVLFMACTIEGSAVLVKGTANADFHNCNIVSRTSGTVCVTCLESREENGFTFMDCNFTCRDGVEESSVFIAEPEDGEGIEPFVFVCKSKLGKHINGKLWKNPEKCRFIIDEDSLLA